MQIGAKKALIVLRVPVSAFSQGKALTRKQVDVIGLSLGETWNGERVKTYLQSLFASMKNENNHCHTALQLSLPS